MNVNRRKFLAASAASGLVLGAPAVHAQSKAKRYRTAIIGTGWWGMNILNCAIEAGASQVVAMCDVDANQLDPAAASVEKKTGSAPKKYKDFRELLAAEKPDICIVATADHWHPLCMIEAVKTGAHVYVEKPISHTIREGRAMVAAARSGFRKQDAHVGGQEPKLGRKNVAISVAVPEIGWRQKPRWPRPRRNDGHRNRNSDVRDRLFRLLSPKFDRNSNY